jgi:hypothetical protein
LYGWPILRGDTPAEAGGVLLLGRGQPNPVYGPFRRLPLLARLVPAPTAFRWDVPATYSVEIVALPDAMPGTLHDYQALLLDAAP